MPYMAMHIEVQNEESRFAFYHLGKHAQTMKSNRLLNVSPLNRSDNAVRISGSLEAIRTIFCFR
jgi:hypothetical protein